MSTIARMINIITLLTLFCVVKAIKTQIKVKKPNKVMINSSALLFLSSTNANENIITEHKKP